MKIFKKSPYLYGNTKQKWYIKLIRGLFYKYVNEMYIPSDIVLSYTYHGKDKDGKQKYGLKLGRTGQHIGVQEHYFFEEPKKLL